MNAPDQKRTESPNEPPAPQHSVGIPLPAPAPGFQWTVAPWGPALRCATLDAVAAHVFSARGLDGHEGRADGADAAPSTSPLVQIAEYLAVARVNVRALHQVHGADVCIATAGSSDHHHWPTADSIATASTELALVVRTADCVPLLMADPRRHAVAAVHAGWRGLAAGVIQATVARLRDACGTDPGNLVVAVGPSIGPDRYEVGEDVREAFLCASHEETACRRWFRPTTPGRYLLDLWQASRDGLEESGVAPARIHPAGLCTATHAEIFHSYRVDGPRAGRMYSAIRAQ